MPPSVTLRAALPDDAPAIARFCLMAGGGSFEYLLDGLSRSTSAEQILTSLAASQRTSYSFQHFTVAESGGTVAGGVNALTFAELSKAEEQILPALKEDARLGALALIRYTFRRIRLATRVRGEPIDAESLILANVAVLPGFTGQGIGAALVERVIELARADGIRCVSLVVWEGNDRARALYERLGFRLVHTARFRALGSMPERGRCLMVRDVDKH